MRWIGRLLGTRGTRDFVARHGPISLERADWLAFLLLGALVVFWFRRLLFTNLIPVGGDMFFYFYPYWHHLSRTLAGGRLPLWNDYTFMGVPFLANSQAGVLYPPNWGLIWLPTECAIKVSIALHVLWAALGAYLLSRSHLDLSPLGALVAAIAFAFGGSVLTHVEQVNQLQGLSWLPWLFLLAGPARARPGRYVILLGVAVGMQLLAGHVQVSFVSIVGLGVYAFTLGLEERPAGAMARGGRYKALLGSLLPVGGAVPIGFCLAAAQILPTIELAAMSPRGGGLVPGDVMVFSLPLPMLGRSLLPPYSVEMFGEYVAYVGVAALGLAGVGAWTFPRSPARTGMLVLAAIGLILALGAYTPVYWLLANLPGFNFFRVPARWMVLFGFGVALLAGCGVERLRSGFRSGGWRGTVLPVGVGLGLVMALTFAAPLAGDEAGAVAPAAEELFRWGMALSATLVVLLLAVRRPDLSAWGAMIVIVCELAVAGEHMPYNLLTAPEALTGYRPAVDHLLAASEDENPPYRFLSISDAAFDPGDVELLEAIYGPQLSQRGLYELIVSVKYQEILAPNLSLWWGVPSVDGYDGGLLPLRAYRSFITLLSDGTPAPDGRLREVLDDIPDGRWLSLTNTRYVITDKVRDLWHDGIMYDRAFSASLELGSGAAAGYVPEFEATGIGLVWSVDGDVEAGIPVATIMVEMSDGSVARMTSRNPGGVEGVTELSWGRPLTPIAVRVSGLAPPGTGAIVRGMTLIDERSGAFMPLTLDSHGRFRLVHSGDVKVYENLDVLPRAFVVYCAEAVADDVEALERMRSPDFDPARVILPVGLPAGADVVCERCLSGVADARVVSYESGHLVIDVNAAGDGYLFVSDSWYPGWHATLDGTEVPIYRADVLFRAVPVPAGRHRVEMRFRPDGLLPGAVISLTAVTSVALAVIVSLLGRGRGVVC